MVLRTPRLIVPGEKVLPAEEETTTSLPLTPLAHNDNLLDLLPASEPHHRQEAARHSMEVPTGEDDEEMEIEFETSSVQGGKQTQEENENHPRDNGWEKTDGDVENPLSSSFKQPVIGMGEGFLRHTPDNAIPASHPPEHDSQKSEKNSRGSTKKPRLLRFFFWPTQQTSNSSPRHPPQEGAVASEKSSQQRVSDRTKDVSRREKNRLFRKKKDDGRNESNTQQHAVSQVSFPSHHEVGEEQQHQDDNRHDVRPHLHHPEELSAGSGASSWTKSAGLSTIYASVLDNGVPMAVLIFLLGLGAVSLLLALGIPSARSEERLAFETVALDLMGRMNQVWEHYEFAAAWVRQSCDMEETVGNREIDWGRLHLREIYQQMQADGFSLDLMGCARNITHDKRPLYENATATFLEEQNKTVPFYGFKEPFPNRTKFHHRTPDTSYFPLHYIEPREKKFRALDLDLTARHGVLKPYIETALETREAVLSERRVIWIGGITNDLSDPVNFKVGIIHPGTVVNDDGQTRVSGQERIGLMDVTIPGLLKHLFRYLPDVSFSVDIHLFDSTNDEENPEFLGAATSRWRDDGDYDKETSPFQACNAVGCFALQHSSSLPTVLSQSYWHVKRTIQIANRQWTMVVVTTRDASQPDLLFVFVSSITLFFTSLFLAVCLVSRQRKDAQHIRYKAQTEAEKAAIRLESAQASARNERELNDYIAHEVRNPLSAAISACSFVASVVASLPSDANKDNLEEDVQTITTSLLYINELLRNMLDMHRAESNEMQLKSSPTDVCTDILQPVEALLYRRDCNFNVSVDCPPELVIQTDKLRLKQIILNLARNSAKFVESGFIRLGAHMLDDNRVRLFVEDSGPGVPESKRHQMFRKFQESLDSMQQGTGIGLAVCQKLIDLLGGEIRLDVDYDSGVPNCPGARFIIDLPTSTAEMDRQPSLSKFNARASVSSVEPLTTSAAAASTDFQVALSSPPSPEVQTPYFSPVITESASNQKASEPHEQRSSISSPYQSEATTANDEKTPDGGPIDASGLCGTFPQHLTVLFVDDNLMLRKLFKRSIQRCFPAWTLETVASGEAALRVTADRSFDLIFMDQYMASVDKQLLGTETVRALRAQGVVSIVCGLSANDMEEAFLNAGANAFLMKPFPSDTEIVRAEVARILQSGKVMERLNAQFSVENEKPLPDAGELKVDIVTSTAIAPLHSTAESAKMFSNEIKSNESTQSHPFYVSTEVLPIVSQTNFQATNLLAPNKDGLHRVKNEEICSYDQSETKSNPQITRTLCSPFPDHLSVLFVDDDKMLRKLFSRSIARHFPEWTLQTAASGEAALKITTEQSFDLIFMDQYMASMDKQLLGTETVRALRAQGVTSTICGLSANDMEEAFLQAGAHAFMIKPFPSDKSVMQNELARILKLEHQNGKGEDPKKSATVSKLTSSVAAADLVPMSPPKIISKLEELQLQQGRASVTISAMPHHAKDTAEELPDLEDGHT